MTSQYKSGTRISEYLLDECVGKGTFGEVWRARHHMWEAERVAVKLPTAPEYVRYLQREGLVVHGLRHANIVRVLGLDPYAEIPYLVMEYVDGPSLKQVIQDHPKGLPIEPAIVVLRGILQAMEAAQQANILHRDLKPGNVMLHLEGRSLAELTVDRVKVGDFGLGLDTDDAIRSVAQSVSIAREENKLVGTLAYLAPELRDGKQKADGRGDLYAIGVILFELLTGERPAGAELPSTIRSDVPAALDEIFRRLYSRHDRRYGSAREVLDELDARLGRRSSLNVPPIPRSATGSGVPPIPAVRETLRCSSCQQRVEPDDQFCTHCGTQVVTEVLRCRVCNGYPGPRDRFCIYCGTEIAPPRG